ncbi:MAG: GNAT family N-acetyltransferase [candidate division WOR-3 bacterium]
MARLSYTPLTVHKPGIILSLLEQSYQELLETDPEHWTAERTSWQEFDRAAFAQPKTIGACMFVTCLDRQAIGFASFEPSQDPQAGFVGHNCIVPQFRRRGFGARQLAEVVRRMQARGIKVVKATTGEHPFFLAARQMYLSFGFVEVGRRPGGPDPGYRLVDFELKPEPPDFTEDWEET